MVGNTCQCIRDLQDEQAEIVRNGAANLPVFNVGQYLKHHRCEDAEIVQNCHHYLPDSNNHDCDRLK